MKTVLGVIAFIVLLYIFAELKHACATGNLLACVVS
jgi:hypothetical protein